MKHTGASYKKRNAEEGLTLIEVMIAVVSLMFGLLVVGSKQISAIRGNYMSGNTSMAISLASEKMEDPLEQAGLLRRPGSHGRQSWP